MDSGLVVLILDKDGQRSALADATRRAGHRVLTSTGVETMLVVLEGLTPDLVIIRARNPEADRSLVARIGQVAPDVPTRIVEAPDMLDGAFDLRELAAN